MFTYAFFHVAEIIGELQARMKKEFKAAKGFESADEEESDDEKRLTTQGDEIKRLVKQNDKTGLYDSDDEDGENPYLVRSFPNILFFYLSVFLLR